MILMGNSAAGLTESVHVDGFSTFSFCKVMQTTQTLFGSNRNLTSLVYLVQIWIWLVVKVAEYSYSKVSLQIPKKLCKVFNKSNIIETKVTEKINKC